MCYKTSTCIDTVLGYFFQLYFFNVVSYEGYERDQTISYINLKEYINIK